MHDLWKHIGRSGANPSEQRLALPLSCRLRRLPLGYTRTHEHQPCTPCHPRRQLARAQCERRRAAPVMTVVLEQVIRTSAAGGGALRGGSVVSTIAQCASTVHRHRVASCSGVAIPTTVQPPYPPQSSRYTHHSPAAIPTIAQPSEVAGVGHARRPVRSKVAQSGVRISRTKLALAEQ